MSRKKLRSKKKNDKKRSSKKSINIVLPVIRNNKILNGVGRGDKKWPPVCTDGTHVPVQLTDSTVPYLVLRNRCHTDVVTQVR